DQAATDVSQRLSHEARGPPRHHALRRSHAPRRAGILTRSLTWRAVTCRLRRRSGKDCRGLATVSRSPVQDEQEEEALSIRLAVSGRRAPARQSRPIRHRTAAVWLSGLTIVALITG